MATPTWPLERRRTDLPSANWSTPTRTVPIGATPTGQMGLFTDDADFLVYMDSRNPVPTQQLRGRDALAPVFDELNVYEATMHFNGQNTTVLEGDHASRVTYCLAHHGAARTLMIAAIRYVDTFVKHDATWFFSQRKLMVDWTETRTLAAS